MIKGKGIQKLGAFFVAGYWILEQLGHGVSNSDSKYLILGIFRPVDPVGRGYW